MARSAHILVVEGKYDENFYGAVCKACGLGTSVKVAPPQGVGGDFNNKEGVFNLLPTLFQQFQDGQVKRLAVAVDADYRDEHGLGYERTIERVAGIAEQYGFTIGAAARSRPGGLRFHSAEGFHDFGLWIMPGDRNDGMLEDWVKKCITAKDIPLLNRAEQAIAGLVDPKFKRIHATKAEISTWLAWQKIPGRGLDYALTENLLNTASAEFAALTRWLKEIYE